MCVRGLVVINPGNPTGGVLSRENQEEVLKLCRDKKLILVADEVYQENVYAEGKSFTSFRQVMYESEFKDEVQMVSLHSTSKGFLGEISSRGGSVCSAVSCVSE